MSQANSAAFDRLVKIMDELREQCPWDKKQTIHTLRQQTIEETYELADAITEANWKDIKEELGDLLLHIVFYSKIGAEQQQFSLEEMINGISTREDYCRMIQYIYFLFPEFLYWNWFNLNERSEVNLQIKLFREF